MAIISVRDNENNGWKRNIKKKTKKTKMGGRGQRGGGRCYSERVRRGREPIDSVVRLS